MLYSWTQKLNQPVSKPHAFNPPGAPHFRGCQNRRSQTRFQDFQDSAKEKEITLGAQTSTDEEVLRTAQTEMGGRQNPEPLGYDL